MFGFELETIHPLFVHFPIALLSTGLLCDLLGMLYRKESLHNAGWWCQVFGIISVVFTIPTGFLADTLIGHMEDPFPILETHGVVQIIASSLLTGLLVWRGMRKSELPEKPLLFQLVAHELAGVQVSLQIFFSIKAGGTDPIP